MLRFARRLAGEQGHDVTIRAAQAIRGVVLGVVVTALIQAAIGGAGLALSWYSGSAAACGRDALPAAWRSWVPCRCSRRPSSGCIGPVSPIAGPLLLVVTIIALAIDNVVRPLLIRRGASLPLLLIFAGVIGGLIAFGIIGLFIGPVVLTVAYTLLAKWVADDEIQNDAGHKV